MRIDKANADLFIDVFTINVVATAAAGTVFPLPTTTLLVGMIAYEVFSDISKRSKEASVTTKFWHEVGLFIIPRLAMKILCGVSLPLRAALALYGLNKIVSVYCPVMRESVKDVFTNMIVPAAKFTKRVVVAVVSVPVAVVQGVANRVWAQAQPQPAA